MTARVFAPALLEELQSALVRRDVRSGFQLLDRAFPTSAKLDFTSPYSISILISIAQWVDLGYRDVSFLDQLSSALAQLNRAQLPVLDFLKLTMVEAYRHLADEQLEQCIDRLDLVIRVGEDMLGTYLQFLANFWKGRALRKRGDYENARLHLAAARAAAEKERAPKLVAVTKIHQSWLAFQDGDRTSAFQLLEEAESVLRSTGHALSLGNIESARGRFVRRSGEYTRALNHFEAAIAIFTKGYPQHPNLARALVNAAYVKHLIAIDMKPKGAGGRARGATHARSVRILHEALDLLEQAGKIYAFHNHQGGRGAVFVNSAQLHLDNGDIDLAAMEGQRAFDLGQDKRDQILMARSRVVLSGVELAYAEEQLGERPDVALHANLAVQYASEAISLALRTQNKRLLAEAYIARAVAAAAEYFQDWDVARDFAAKGAAPLTPNDRDHLFRVLGELRTKLTGAMRVEDRLRHWSDGQLGNKTFQQIQEEFAEIVIPKVWLQSGKNVTSVARSLRISPKKIRRILRNTKHEMG